MSGMDLSEFLLARIGEDEAVARVATPSPWRYNPQKAHRRDYEESVFTGPPGADAVCIASTGPMDDQQSMADAAHIARHDPARILAECAAKRRIVEADARRWRLRQDAPNGLGYGSDPTGLIRVRLGDSDELMTLDQFNQRYCERAEPSEHIRLLALPYADHPDYDPAWRPEETAHQ